MPGTLVCEAVVDGDVAARVRGDAGRVEAEVVGVGPAPDRQQHVGADHLRLALGAVDADRDAVGVRREADALGVRCARRCPRLAGCRATASETSASSRAISRGAHLDDGDLGAEAAVHLRELQPDVAAADHHQVLGHRVELRACAVLVRYGTASTPGMSGTRARPPTLMKMRCGAQHARRRPRPRARDRSGRGRAKTVQPSMPRSQLSTPARAVPRRTCWRARRPPSCRCRRLRRARRRIRRRGGRDGRRRRWPPASWSACSRC